MDKRPAWLAVIVVVALLASSLAIWYLGKEKEGEDRLAIVTFELDDGSSVSFTCEVASTPEERSVGLMGRGELPLDGGMLFVFDAPCNATFWMKDTLIPLDIVFVHENGTVVKVAEADPEPDTPIEELTRYASDTPVIWVVELNQGECRENGIAPGTRMTISYVG